MDSVLLFISCCCLERDLSNEARIIVYDERLIRDEANTNWGRKDPLTPRFRLRGICNAGLSSRSCVNICRTFLTADQCI